MSLVASMSAAAEAMSKATSIIDSLNKENALLREIIRRMRTALEDIEDRAQDKYDGPEDRTHGPYLQMAQEGLGIVP